MVEVREEADGQLAGHVDHVERHLSACSDAEPAVLSRGGLQGAQGDHLSALKSKVIVGYERL